MSAMKVVERWYSQRVEREVTLARWGHFGTPVLVFPTAGGDAEEIERMHLVGACGELLDAGRIKIYSCDSIAGKAMVENEGDFSFRTKLLNQFQQMIAEEIVPAIHADCGGQQLPMVAAGASIGAFNALAVQCRYPWTFRTSICMSGSYRLQRFLGGDYSPDLYLSSPLDYLPGLEGPVLDQLRRGFVLLTSGEGAWEAIGESWEVANILGTKGIPNRVDSWGTDWEHGWDTWRAMLPAYLREFT